MENVNLLIAVVAIVLGITLYVKKLTFSYWKKKGVPYIEPEFPYGNTKGSIKKEKHVGEEFGEFYREFKRRGEKHGGVYMFLNPVYVPVDPELVKCILQKDFDHFVNRGMYVNEEVDPLTGHLFNLEDTKWKNLRAKLTPTFTSGKMKMMFQTLVACGEELEKILNDHSTVQDAVNIKELLACFTTDIIGSCAFGLDCNSLKNPDSEFRAVGRKLFTPTNTGYIRRMIRLAIPLSFLKMIGFRTTPKEYEDFFTRVVKKTIEYREKNNVTRKDFMHLLLELRNKGKVTEDDSISELKESDEKNSFMTLNEITAQCFVFFIAGFETSSTTMSFALYELATNHSIQDKLREEIRSVLRNNKLTYDAVMEMAYLDKVINETLRLHSPALLIQRTCTKAYHVPGTDAVLDPGVKVSIPILGLHMDPEFYPNPEVYDPERFSEENKAKRPSSTFIPFGDGPRICIGLRFGLLQSKVGLIKILENYRVSLNSKTKVPIELDPLAVVATVKGGVWLNIAKIDGKDAKQ